MGTRGYSEDEDERCGDGEDDGERTTVNTTSTSTSSPAIPREYRMPSHDSGRNNGPQILRTYPQDDQSLGDPLFLQYPIGDGCHMVVAMYVEKDAQSASRRFPNIARARLESSNRTKTPEEVAVIFREALEDEKKNVTG
ncbi:hypothetical protein BGZ58_009209 [Dissophora ornata]|nr:hypothetical protein BGZ58_009209 [Dissophora ornata]